MTAVLTAALAGPGWPSDRVWTQRFALAVGGRSMAATEAPSSHPLPAMSAEAVLIEAAQAGSSQAFSRLVERHQQAVRAFLRRTCGDAALADDLAQETFLAAWMQIRRFDGRASFRSWLCGVAYRKHLGGRRAAMRGLRRDGDWAQAQAMTLREEAEPSARLALQDAMATLPADQRAAVALCLAADFSNAEAAAALDLPLGTVKSHVARGRLKLLERLEAAHVRS